MSTRAPRVTIGLPLYNGERCLEATLAPLLAQTLPDFELIIAEVRDFATEWLWTYNNERPNMALGGITPRMKTAMAA